MTALLNSQLTAVATSLQYVAETTLTLRGLENGLVSVNRYIWEPLTIDDATSEKFAYRNKNPKLVATDKYNFAVHCWGATYDDAQCMRWALRQALKENSSGRAGFEFGQARWTFPDWAKTGFVLTQNVGLLIASVEINLPTIALAYPALLETNTYDTVTITSFENLPVTSTGGDGILEQGED